MVERSSHNAGSIPGATLAEIEKYAILRTLAAMRGATSSAARILGISPRKIQYRLREYKSAESATPGSAMTAVV